MVIAFFFVLAIVLYFVYQWLKVPEGVTPMNGSSETVAWLVFGTSLVSLLTATLGLIQKIVEKKNND